MKTNPLYKGIWSAPLVDNPAYKGVWSPRKIPNPNYYEDLHPADLHPIGAVGYELWTMTEDIMFDNIYVGDSPEDAKALAAETFHVKHRVEQALKDEAEEEKKAKQKEAEEAAKIKNEGGVQAVLQELKDDPMGYVRGKVMDFVEDVQEDGPVEALKANPQVGGLLLASLLTLFGALGALFGLVGSQAKPVVKVRHPSPCSLLNFNNDCIVRISSPSRRTLPLRPTVPMLPKRRKSPQLHLPPPPPPHQQKHLPRSASKR